MTVTELIELANNYLASLQTSRQAAWSVGNVEAIAALDADIAETNVTLSQLLSLAS